MSAGPLVSILIPAYNAGPWVAEAIESALSQTWGAKEILVWDDGSSDDTLSIAERFHKRGVRVFTHPNQGASATRNQLYAKSQGEFIQWLDADDLLTPDKIERQLSLRSSDEFVVLSAWGTFYYRAYAARLRRSVLWADAAPAEWLQRKFESNAWMAIQSWLVPRIVAEKAGPWSLDLTADDDGEYFARIVTKAKGVKFAADAYSYVRRSNPRSLSKGVTSPRWLKSQLTSLIRQVGYLRTLDDGERTRAACLALLNRWFVYFYPEYPDLMGVIEKVAAELGGAVAVPRMRWKYQLIQSLFGWQVAKKAQFTIPTLKAWLESELDRLLAKASPGRLSGVRSS